MIKHIPCPLCGSNRCSVTDNYDCVKIDCQHFGTAINIQMETYEDYNKSPIFQKMLNLMVERIMHNKRAPNQAYWVFYYMVEETTPPDNPAYVNLAPYMTTYPSTVMEYVNRILLNLSLRYPDYGKALPRPAEDCRLYYPDSAELDKMQEHANNMVRIITELGYIKEENHTYSISASGWKYIEELRKKHAETKQGFIAMSFATDAKFIREAFRTAIQAAGYIPMVIDEKEHNHQIVPELLYEIDKSKFLVLDVTYPNYGAYYEAGYALGKGKEVIICCKNDVFNDAEHHQQPHFDIAQTSQIRWDTTEELVERLKKRIIATV